ncbi:DNA methyltransferase [Kiritimatiella glycovorans]|uniref:site-specific DNA-methyltransferase (adenine-specific) n=1 Tax=Kiritimatiella glycovorans TaxID=1307763 RepID=A0A0G3EII7_9BACT|nr:site-specific DNA-methyltransferase [Kiritimatiella glycovorans]AKJ63954.1 Modification methylase MboII [Kiritimatiella glycovorans]
MLKLTDQEKQEIVRFIEAGKELPEKYRFLLFEDKREVELVWNGKTNEVCNLVLPFQTIEQVDEPRAESTSDTAEYTQTSLFDVDTRGRQLKGWTNKLIWGDNKLILSSLKNGPLREEIEAQGGLKLIYIDPPFDVGADFSMDIEIGGDTFTKKPNILEEIAYRDTWGKGADSFIAMIYERLILMRDLLAEDGSIYVHCDWRVNSFIRLVMDDIFGSGNQRNQIRWCYRGGGVPKNDFAPKHDTIFRYSKGDAYTFNLDDVRIPYSEDVLNSDPSRYDKSYRDNAVYEGYVPNEKGKHPEDWWTIQPIMPSDKTERVGYPTQKPVELIQRIIDASTNPDDLIADFFCGSGTTIAVAQGLRVKRVKQANGKEKLHYYFAPQRRWIGSDLSKFAIHTTRKRMIGVQRQRKAEGQDYRAFEILNLGKYERQHFVGVNPNLREEEQAQQLAQKEAAFLELILRAYRAEPVAQFESFHGKRAGRLVAIGPVNLPVTRLFVEEIILECRKKHITKVDILGFEFEMGLFPNVLDEARAKGIDIAPKYIPAEVFDKRAVEKNQVVFHDVSFIEVKPHVKAGKKGQPATVAVELTDFSVFYSQDSIAQAEEALGKTKRAGSKIVVEKGQIVKLSKDKKGVMQRETLTDHWTDWIDYWSVDFDFESKREIIRIQDLESGETREEWTGDYIFENEWQSFRTKKDRSLELTSVAHEVTPGRRKIAVKVVDIFGNDTMTIVEINVGGGK